MVFRFLIAALAMAAGNIGCSGDEGPPDGGNERPKETHTKTSPPLGSHLIGRWVGRRGLIMELTGSSTIYMDQGGWMIKGTWVALDENRIEVTRIIRKKEQKSVIHFSLIGDELHFRNDSKIQAVFMREGTSSAMTVEGKRAQKRNLALDKVPACESFIDRLDKSLDYYVIRKSGRQYPPSGNLNMVQALMDSKEYLFKDGDLNEKGEAIDPWGKPLVYHRTILPEDHELEWKPRNRRSFDLYSFGPNGIDESGKGDDPNNWD